MLQEAVDALFDNGPPRPRRYRCGQSLAEIVERHAQGQEADASARTCSASASITRASVIVIVTELKLHQCGLPKKMALVSVSSRSSFAPQGIGLRAHGAQRKKMIERQSPEVWDILEEGTKGHPVMLIARQRSTGFRFRLSSRC
jgi:DNA-directed RNA polymerase subunit beta'